MPAGSLPGVKVAECPPPPGALQLPPPSGELPSRVDRSKADELVHTVIDPLVPALGPVVIAIDQPVLLITRSLVQWNVRQPVAPEAVKLCPVRSFRKPPVASTGSAVLVPSWITN